MDNHFKGIVPSERWQNDVLSELRMIRELLVRNAQAIQQAPENVEPIKRQYRRKGVAN